MRKKTKKHASRLLIAIALFLLLALLIPAIGVSPESSDLWISIVEFFTSIRTHIQEFWMFYSLAGVVLVAYFGKKK